MVSQAERSESRSANLANPEVKLPFKAATGEMRDDDDGSRRHTARQTHPGRNLGEARMRASPGTDAPGGGRRL